MADGQMGLGGAILGALLRPKRLAKAWRRGGVRASPFVVYALGILAGATGVGILIGLSVETSAVAWAFMGLVAGFVLVAPYWFIGTAVTHLVLRVLGGEGTLRDTKAGVGLGHAPRLLTLVALLSIPAELWAAVSKPGELWVLGDSRDHSSDSRSWDGGRGRGVPLENLKGRAWALWLPLERLGITLGGDPVLPRSFEQLRPELAVCLAHRPSLRDSTPPPPRAAL